MDEQGDAEKPKTRAQILAEQLATKRLKNQAREKAAEEAGEEERLAREIAIEDQRTAAYDAGLTNEQLIECEWPVIGKCLARTPSDVVYREFAHKSGILKGGDLTNDIAIHEKVAMACMLVPDGKTFVDLARSKNPHAPVQFGGAMIERMRGKMNAEGK